MESAKKKWEVLTSKEKKKDMLEIYWEERCYEKYKRGKWWDRKYKEWRGTGREAQKVLSSERRGNKSMENTK